MLLWTAGMNFYPIITDNHRHCVTLGDFEWFFFSLGIKQTNYVFQPIPQKEHCHKVLYKNIYRTHVLQLIACVYMLHFQCIKLMASNHGKKLLRVFQFSHKQIHLESI